MPRLAAIARGAGNFGRAFRLAALPGTQRQYTGTVLEREAERAELASGLLAKVGGHRLAGAGFEVCPLAPPSPLPASRRSCGTPSSADRGCGCGNADAMRRSASAAGWV